MSELKGVFAVLESLREREFPNFGTANSTEVFDNLGEKIEEECFERLANRDNLSADEKQLASDYFHKDFEVSMGVARRNYDYARDVGFDNPLGVDSLKAASRMVSRAAGTTRSVVRVCVTDESDAVGGYLAWLTEDNYTSLNDLKGKLANARGFPSLRS